MAIWPSFQSGQRLALAVFAGLVCLTTLARYSVASAENSQDAVAPANTEQNVATPLPGQMVFAKNFTSPWLIFSHDERESLAENWIHWNEVPASPVAQSAALIPASAQFPAADMTVELVGAAELVNTTWEGMTESLIPPMPAVPTAQAETPQLSAWIACEQVSAFEHEEQQSVPAPVIVFSHTPTAWVGLDQQPPISAPELDAITQQQLAHQQFIQLNTSLLAEYEQAETEMLMMAQSSEQSPARSPLDNSAETLNSEPEAISQRTKLTPAGFAKLESAGRTEPVLISQTDEKATQSTEVDMVSPEQSSDVWGETEQQLTHSEEAYGGCLEDCPEGECRCQRQGPGRANQQQRHAKAQGLNPSGRELAPLQLIWPKRWAWAAAEDPWASVFQAEHKPTVTHCPGVIVGPGMGELSAGQSAENSVLLESDLPVARMRLHTATKPGRMPQERNADLQTEQPLLCNSAGTHRGWEMRSVHWNAPETSHAPLYFEEISLERAGYTRGYLQPFYSGAKFFATVPLLPGLMTIDGPVDKQYELGEDRPGSIVAYSTRRPEWTVKAILVEASVVTGLSFIIP